MITGIYCITNTLNNKKYIGQSIDIENRWKQHCNSSSKGTMRISRAIKKYGKESFTFKLLHECEESLLNKLELYFITKYETIAPKGYNTCIPRYGPRLVVKLLKLERLKAREARRKANTEEITNTWFSNETKAIVARDIANGTLKQRSKKK